MRKLLNKIVLTGSILSAVYAGDRLPYLDLNQLPRKGILKNRGSLTALSFDQCVMDFKNPVSGGLSFMKAFNDTLSNSKSNSDIEFIEYVTMEAIAGYIRKEQKPHSLVKYFTNVNAVYNNFSKIIRHLDVANDTSATVFSSLETTKLFIKNVFDHDFEKLLVVVGAQVNTIDMNDYALVKHTIEPAMVAFIAPILYEAHESIFNFVSKINQEMSMIDKEIERSACCSNFFWFSRR